MEVAAVQTWDYTATDSCMGVRFRPKVGQIDLGTYPGLFPIIFNLTNSRICENVLNFNHYVNPGLFQIKCQYILADWCYFGSIWPTLCPNLPSQDSGRCVTAKGGRKGGGETRGVQSDI